MGKNQTYKHKNKETDSHEGQRIKTRLSTTRDGGNNENGVLRAVKMAP